VAASIKLIDIQGWDHDCGISNASIQPGNYLDEIRKADCDIYVLVFEGTLSDDQVLWVKFIEEQLQRQCILVQSKVDIPFARTFYERTRIRYEKSSEEQRRVHTEKIISTLRRNSQRGSHRVYLVAADYFPDSDNADFLLRNESFDFQALMDRLNQVDPWTRHARFKKLTVRAIARAINTSFRRAYMIKVLHYQVAAGIASFLPFGDRLPRYVARKEI
jgi:hypothetical protein